MDAKLRDNTVGNVYEVTDPLSLRIPALLIRMVTVPKVSTAVLMTDAPSVTDDVLATALPPAEDGA